MSTSGGPSNERRGYRDRSPMHRLKKEGENEALDGSAMAAITKSVDRRPESCGKNGGVEEGSASGELVEMEYAFRKKCREGRMRIKNDNLDDVIINMVMKIKIKINTKN